MILQTVHILILICVGETASITFMDKADEDRKNEDEAAFREAEARERLAEAERNRRFTFTERGRCRGRHEDVLRPGRSHLVDGLLERPVELFRGAEHQEVIGPLQHDRLEGVHVSPVRLGVDGPHVGAHRHDRQGQLLEERRRRAASDEALARRLESRGVEDFVDRWQELPLFATQRRLPAAFRERQRTLRLRHRPAGLALALSSPNVQYCDLDGHFDLAGDPSLPQFGLEEGWFTAPDLPGFGLSVHPPAPYGYTPAEHAPVIAELIEQLITEVSAKTGEKIEVARFARLQVGGGS